MAATFVIFLREGIEASMIVAILLAYLKRLGLERHFRDVFLGVGVAFAVVLVGGVTAYLTLKTYAGSRTQTIFETVTYLVAAAVLTYMTFWMRRHAPSLSRELRERTDAAIDGKARWGLALLAFQAVGREGLETMVFTLAIVFASSAHGVIGGGVAGLVVALVIAFAIYRLGARLNFAVFFKVVGVLLMVFAAGILADAVQNLQELGWVNFLHHALWNTSGTLSEDSTLGDIVHSFFGYAQQPTVLQVTVYVCYVAVAVTAFILLGRSRPGSPGAAVPGAPVAAGSADASASKLPSSIP
ncbi:FTR1 family protein [Acidiferrimicrobium sp. IK]|uniref:FTR1 family iron permease n=1 Tax=Acidiferrimicrobium sp. IK TaxID=2871700 RepID=UPI0021CB60F9|nr:FTR1 family protein [Acidiferrimicrobium sp. IK]MCU4184452.1 FTR1 family protein [Acidiferrimicrobium sp. IK]